MTAIRGAITPTRRPGELGVHSVDRFHFAVPDLAIAKNFYGEFGLEIDEDGGHLAVKTRGNPHVWVTLGEGQRKKLGHISFGAFDDDFDRFAQRLLALGIKRLDPPRGVETNGLWFHDHDGNLIEIKVAAKSSPNEKSDFSEVPGGPSARAAPFRRDVARVAPRRLAHVLLFTRDVEKAVQFYRRVLGLRLSDRSGEGIAFLHGIHGSDHHMIAFVKSSAPGLHHLSWDVGSVDEIGRGAMHMLDKGFARGGASDGMSSARTFSTMSATPGGLSANIPPASTLCLPIATGTAATTRRRIPSTCGGPTRRTISRTMPRREARAHNTSNSTVPKPAGRTISSNSQSSE
jgi:catechol 2,3-dioxygenase-like lactoylglutathione lyase family enzyme